MIKRQRWIFGLASLGLVLAAPVHAAPDFMDGSVIVAKRDQADEVRQGKRDTRKDDRRDARREAEREEAQGYGYGYERRHQERNEQEGRPRDRR
ncbi:MAG: hypothetical protein IV089_08500 [Thiobacillus sp.]|nr:hypothetical protein [Thiobacillus sp.]